MRRAFVVTASLAVCSCTPPRTRKTSPPTASTGKTFQALDYRTLAELNPRDGKGRRIYASGEQCFVLLPAKGRRDLGAMPETKQVDCPPSMDDSAWDQCSFGTILRSTEAPMCICSMDGNPPPLPREVTCPR